jgi:hypothetical protein
MGWGLNRKVAEKMGCDGRMKEELKKHGFQYIMLSI